VCGAFGTFAHQAYTACLRGQLSSNVRPQILRLLALRAFSMQNALAPVKTHENIRSKAIDHSQTQRLMKVECTHRVDASERDTDGEYDWYYEYDIYRFTEGDRTLIARSYTDTSSEAHFLHFEVQSRPVRLTTQDTKDPLLLEAATFLKSLGKKRLEFLGPEGYAPLPTEA
jgi:hypothetical protein